MRNSLPNQLRFDCPTIPHVNLNVNCRDDMIPILRSLQAVYENAPLRDQILQLIAADVNETSDSRRGRPGLDYWEVLVLAAVRLGLNVDYDRLQDLAENHRQLRHIMGVGDWQAQDATPQFDWRRIRDNIQKVKPETIQRLNQLIVAEGHRLAPGAAAKVRVDSFVVETNVHYPTDSSLLQDGVLLVLSLAVALAKRLDVSTWRQHKHLKRKTKRLAAAVARVSRSHAAEAETWRRAAYGDLLAHAEWLLSRAEELVERVRALGKRVPQSDLPTDADELARYITLSRRVAENARQRVLLDETVPHDEKLFSIFEPETQLLKRGKARQEVQFGHMVLIMEDQLGFVCHYAILPRGKQDVDVAVPELKAAQEHLGGVIESASFDQNFHSPENQKALAAVVRHPCLPQKGNPAKRQAQARASVEFREARQRHPGVESAIGALEAGNGLRRCRDHSYARYKRYVGLGILGRNLLVLGRLLIAREHRECVAAYSRREAA